MSHGFLHFPDWNNKMQTCTTAEFALESVMRRYNQIIIFLKFLFRIQIAFLHM